MTDRRRYDGLWLVLGAVTVVVSSMVVQLGEDLVVRCSVGVAATVVLLSGGIAARRCGRGAADGLLAFAALSVFGWFSALVTGSDGIEQMLTSTPPAAQFVVVNAMKLSSLAVLIIVGLVCGWSRRDLLITPGRWSAPTGLPHVRWTIAAPVIAVAVAALFLTDPAVTASPLPLDEVVATLLSVLPLLIIGPLINAVAEEILYRLAILGTIGPRLGVVPAVAMSSIIFGIGHLTGSPPGWFGVAATGVFGVVICIVILQTRGTGWAIIIHVVADLAAITAITLAGAS